MLSGFSWHRSRLHPVPPLGDATIDQWLPASPERGRTYCSAQSARGAMVMLAMLGILAFHSVLLGFSNWCHSPVYCEISCLPAGLSHLQLGRFDMYRVNPPLIRTIATIPAAFAGCETDWSGYEMSPLGRSWQDVGVCFLKANGARSFRLYTWGRWACIPFGLLGGWVCFRWASRLYGATAGLTATTLWCFCPYVLGHASLMTPDAHAAAVGLAAGYVFWRWLSEPYWNRALLTGLVLGVAELCKFTLLVFYPLWLAMWILYRLPDRRQMHASQWLRELLQFTVITAVSVLTINFGYCFEGSFQRLGDYQFQSQTMTADKPLADVPAFGGNRFAGTWLGSLPVPLPKNYLQGIDTQKLDFERGLPSYLRGEWSKHGWWYYYL